MTLLAGDEALDQQRGAVATSVVDEHDLAVWGIPVDEVTQFRRVNRETSRLIEQRDDQRERSQGRVGRRNMRLHSHRSWSSHAQSTGLNRIVHLIRVRRGGGGDPVLVAVDVPAARGELCPCTDVGVHTFAPRSSMNAARYLVGLGAMAVALVPVLIGSRALCRRLLPRFVGPAAWLATTVVALTIVIVASEVLGSVGLFALLPVVVTFAGVGFLAWCLGCRGSAARDAVSDSPRSEPRVRAEEDRTGRWGTFAAIAAVALVTAEWSIRTVDSLRYGMMGIDTLWYHLPVAARFADSGRTWDLHYVDGQSLTVFYPAVSELLHGLGIVFLGTDLLSPLLNTFWLALALLAGWCFGRPYSLSARHTDRLGVPCGDAGPRAAPTGRRNERRCGRRVVSRRSCNSRDRNERPAGPPLRSFDRVCGIGRRARVGHEVHVPCAGWGDGNRGRRNRGTRRTPAASVALVCRDRARRWLLVPPQLHRCG